MAFILEFVKTKRRNASPALKRLYPSVVAVVLADVLCHQLPSILNGFRRQVVAHVLENPLGCLGKLVVVVRGGGAAASTEHRPAGRSSGWRAAGSEGSSP
jgi:hypothetical protein